MALATKQKIVLSFGMLVLMLVGSACILLYAVLGDIEVNITAHGNSLETHEANRKLKVFNEAVAAKKPGFIRLSEPEINGLLQNRYGKLDGKAGKNRTTGPVQLVKVGVLLHQSDLTFITWHKVSLFGFDFPVVWQRVVSPQRVTNGWRLSLDEMHVGKLTIPGSYWADVSGFLGGADNIFEERKVWLASVPTVMLCHNEITHAVELRLYSYVPVIKSETEPLPGSENLNTSAAGSTNTLAAKLSP